jgi:large subunit ribosomal protein L18
MTAKRKTSFQRRKMGTRSKLRRVNIEQNAKRAIRPRLSVHRTNKQIYAQIIDDINGVTLAAASSLDKDSGVKGGHTVDAAAQVGKLVAERAVKAGVKKVQFDRGGFVYHGRIKAIADGAREGGLEF